MFFTPQWKKEAKLLAKGGRKFLNYKRDLLKPDRIAEIESRERDLLDAIRSGDREKTKEASNQLRATCDNALPSQTQPGWFEDNVEVMFVAIVIALGLRAYYLQPFRIPTGSMQPTLNGITGHPLAEKEWPSLPARLAEWVHRGRSYVKIVNDRDRVIMPNPFNPGRPRVEDFQKAHFFSRSLLYFKDSAPLELPSTGGPMLDAGLQRAYQDACLNHGGLLKKGAVIAEGYIDTGDLVLVDKISYHFRKPKRGEVFVFDTIEIEKKIRQFNGDQAAGSNYIKRLCGLPGDELSVQTPNLLNHGRILQEPGIQRVAQHQGEYGKLNPRGYLHANDPRGRIAEPGAILFLKDKGGPGQREYAACGDNTGNSLDSRYWGQVREYNLVGPALFSLWPFTTGHWGLID